MNVNSPDAGTTSFARWVCRWIILASLALWTGRLVAVENLIEPSLYQRYARTWPKESPQPSPTFSSNDRSRWATVRSLVDEGTFVIGRRVADEKSPTGFRDEGILFEQSYRSIDVVMDPDRKLFFSTKPPLLTVLCAGEYWLLQKIFGWDIDKHRWQVIVTILLTWNILPFGLYLLLLEKILFRLPVSNPARVYCLLAASLGTFLGTFSNTLNNHSPAAFFILLSLRPWLIAAFPVAGEQPPVRRDYLFSGLWAGLAAAFDLPSAAFGGLLFFYLIRMNKASMLLYVMGCLFFPLLQQFINYQAIGIWKPTYAMFGGPWYEFEGSHWLKLKQTPRPAGIDFAEDPKWVYLFHLTFGHHGLFSLTPVFLIGFSGYLFTFRQANFRWLATLTFLLVFVLITYYVFKSNNYGGFTSGPRWLFWLTPLLLLGIPSGYDRLAALGWGRFILPLSLMVSIFSCLFPLMNPWRHPWIFQLGEYVGWFRY